MIYEKILYEFMKSWGSIYHINISNDKYQK